MIVLAHGQTPEESDFGTDEETLCRGVELREDERLDLFRRWSTVQRTLARAGYVSIAIDLADRDDVAWSGGGAPIEDAVAWLLNHPDSSWAPRVDPTRTGLVGHSAGASKVNLAAPSFGQGVPVAVIGPTPHVILDAPNLVVGSENDMNHGSPEVYANSAAPKHKVFFTNQTHWAYFDGLCAQPEGPVRLARDEAYFQRTTTARALRRFFDRYLRGAEWTADLGLGRLEGVVAEGER